MHWSTRVLAGGVYSVLLLFCSVAGGSFLACLCGGMLGMWPMAAFFLFWFVLFGCWHVLLFFGAWVAAFPPRRWLSWLLFLLAAVAAGLLASQSFQQVRPWDFEHDEVPLPPPPVEMVSLTSLVSCTTAVVGTAACLLLVRRWFPYLPSNHVLQRTPAASLSFLR